MKRRKRRARHAGRRDAFHLTMIAVLMTVLCLMIVNIKEPEQTEEEQPETTHAEVVQNPETIVQTAEETESKYKVFDGMSEDWGSDDLLLKDGIRTRSGDRCIVKNQIGVQFQMVIVTFELATHQRVRRRCTVRNWRKRFAPVILDSVVQIRWYYDKSDRVRNQRQQPHGRRRGG